MHSRLERFHLPTRSHHGRFFSVYQTQALQNGRWEPVRHRWFGARHCYVVKPHKACKTPYAGARSGITILQSNERTLQAPEVAL